MKTACLQAGNILFEEIADIETIDAIEMIETSNNQQLRL